MACCVLPDISSVFMKKNRIFRILAIIFARLGFSEVSGLFSTSFEISIWNMVYTFSRYFITKNRSKSYFCIHGLKNYIEAWDMVHTYIYIYIYSECLDLYWFSSWLGNCWPSGGQKHPEGGVSRATSQRKVFWTFFSTCFEISVWNLVYTSSWHCHTSS